MSSSRTLSRSLRSKGGEAFARRVRLITHRFGWSPAPLVRAMALYADVLREQQAAATWTVTANAARRHPAVLAPYRESLVELGIHGWRHTDHQCSDLPTQHAEVQRALAELARLGLQPAGWRSPYLRSGAGTLAEVGALGLRWEASASLEFPCARKQVLSARGADTWERAIAFYGAEPWEARLALPWVTGGVVRFPTALPDDEMLIDRLSLPTADLTAIWLGMFDRTYADGELLVMQLHPERARDFAAPLAALLARARAARPAVWIASLSDLADWWRRRATAQLVVAPAADGWAVAVEGPMGPLAECVTPRASVALVAAGDAPLAPPPPAPARVLTIPGGAWPGVGVGGPAAPSVVARLRAIGLAAELRAPGRTYAATLDDPADTALAALVRRIAQGEGLAGPLVRLAHWPEGYRSAVAITGDLCAITLYDFAARIAGMA
ncbi:MAG TPA: polysaccharide deacetylase family protein [Chloroflexota bacterium]|nr:polysaccharide deacetylase family protein [Chloroflexota bacterium]